MVEVVEDQSCHSDHAKIFPRSRRSNAFEFRIFRMEREADECLESARLILDITKCEEMLKSLFYRFDMPVEHRGIREDAEFVRRFHNGDPLCCRRLVGADLFADRIIEYLRTTAGERVKPCFVKSRQHFFDREVCDLCEMDDLDRCECFEMYIREMFFYLYSK